MSDAKTQGTSGEGGAASSQAGQQAQGAGEPNFEKWLEGQDETVKGLYDSHTKNLKSALERERESRKAFEGQVKELLGKAEAGSELAGKLATLSTEFETAERKNAFYEEAIASGVSNLKLAWLAASTEQLFDKKSKPDFAALREKYPEVFAPAAAGNAGNGANQNGAGFSMDDFIRNKTK